MDAEQSIASVRDQIIETARRFFNDKGFDRTSVDDIIRQLGLEDHHFSEHFQSLDDILEEIWSGR